ncbi:MAG: hypothetical protein HY744_32615 [Deltaproteobacteria bacterium]|nr:hypothetical protein [Deltaproteobacteria bacterium]
MRRKTKVDRHRWPVGRHSDRPLDGGRAADLFDWLEGAGRSRHHLLGLALERLRRRGPSGVPLDWVAKKLDSKALWDDPGAKIISALLDGRNMEGARHVIQLCLAGPRQMTSAMHTAVGVTLLAAAEDGLLRGDARTAHRALTALAHLSPASRLRDRVRELRKPPGADAVMALIDVNDALLRRSGSGEVATVDAIDAALTVFVLGDEESGEQSPGPSERAEDSRPGRGGP